MLSDAFDILLINISVYRRQKADRNVCYSYDKYFSFSKKKKLNVYSLLMFLYLEEDKKLNRMFVFLLVSVSVSRGRWTAE